MDVFVSAFVFVFVLLYRVLREECARWERGDPGMPGEVRQVAVAHFLPTTYLGRYSHSGVIASLKGEGEVVVLVLVWWKSRRRASGRDDG